MHDCFQKSIRDKYLYEIYEELLRRSAYSSRQLSYISAKECFEELYSFLTRIFVSIDNSVSFEKNIFIDFFPVLNKLLYKISITKDFTSHSRLNKPKRNISRESENLNYCKNINNNLKGLSTSKSLFNKQHNNNSTVINSSKLGKTKDMPTISKHLKNIQSKLPECQKFSDEHVLQWLQNKEYLLKEANKSKRAEERAKQKSEYEAECNRKKRAELAAEAFNNWLQKKTKIIKNNNRSPKESSTFHKLTNDKSDSQTTTQSVQFFKFKNNSPSYSLPIRDTKKYKPFGDRSDYDSNEKKSINCVKKLNSDSKNCVTEYLNNTFQNFSTPLYASNESLIETEYILSSITPQEVTQFENAIPLSNKLDVNLLHKNEVSASNFTHQDWLRHKFILTRYKEQANREAQEKIALVENLDPKFLQTWRDLLKIRCIDLENQRLLFEKYQMPLTRTSSLSRQIMEWKQSNRINNRHQNKSEQKEANKVYFRRRRLHLRVPSETPNIITQPDNSEPNNLDLKTTVDEQNHQIIPEIIVEPEN